MAVIAGDIDGGGLPNDLGTLFTDWMFFDRADNDLVVDTASMYGGLAYQAEARAIFVQSDKVNHFRYFPRRHRHRGWTSASLGSARWLSEPDPAELPEWASRAQPATDLGDTLTNPPPPPLRKHWAPILVFLPGIMGSNLDADQGAYGSRLSVLPEAPEPDRDEQQTRWRLRAAGHGPWQADQAVGPDRSPALSPTGANP